MSSLSKALAIFLLTAAAAFAAPILDIEKTTNGPTNSNPTAPDYDNEDTLVGPGVPILTPGSTVTWTYKVTNTGDVGFGSSQLRIVDNNGTPGNTADDLSNTGGQITFQSVQTGDADNILEPSEIWLFRATGIVQNGNYENRATVSAPDVPDTQGDLDFSHYIGRPLVSMLDIEKTTNGPTNSNPTAPDYDNEDTLVGPGVPILTPGSTVTWTYKVTNTGTVVFTSGDVAIVDDNGTPGNTADDFSRANGQITFQSVETGDGDNLLEPGEVWLFGATGIVHAGVYGNRGTASALGATDFDLSHYVTQRTIPQPETLWLFGIGAGAAILARRRKKLPKA